MRPSNTHTHTYAGTQDRQDRHTGTQDRQDRYTGTQDRQNSCLTTSQPS